MGRNGTWIYGSHTTVMLARVVPGPAESATPDRNADDEAPPRTCCVRISGLGNLCVCVCGCI